LSQSKTLEFDLHAAGPAAQRFLVLYQISSWEVAETRPWRDTLSSHVSEAGPHRHIVDSVEELYWLDFVMHTEEMNKE
jgi:hypothetical protein